MTPRTPKDNIDDRQLTQVLTNTWGVDPVIEDKKEQVEEIMQNEWQNESQKILQENFIHTRLYMVRHYPYDEEQFPEHEEYEELLTKASTSILSSSKETKLWELRKKVRTLEDFNELPSILKEKLGFIFNKNEIDQTIILCDFDDSTERVQKSAQDLIKKFNIKNVQKISLPKWDYVERNSQEADTEAPWVFGENIEIINNLLTSWKYKNIIIIWNRTYAHSFDLFTREERGVIESYKKFEKEWYFHADYNISYNKQRNKRVANLKSKEPCHLKIIPENYPSLPPSFLKIPHSSITDLQNKLNAHFIRNPQLFEKYISSGNIDLKVFCVANLLKDKENKRNIWVVMDYYKWTNKVLSEKEENILWENRGKQETLSILANLARKGLVKSALIRDQLTEFVKVLDIQSRSLDVKINEQEDNWVLPRDVFWVEERVREVDSEDSWKRDNGEKEKITEHITHKVNYEDLLMSTTGTGKFVLPAHVGSGKSIWLSEFAKRVMLNHPEYQVYFFEWSDFNGGKNESRMWLLKEQLKGANDKSIVFIDAIDEIYDDTTKQEIKKLLETTRSRIIVTWRPSEYNDKENHWFITLQVRPISKEDFIYSRIGDEKKGREVLSILKASNLSQEVEWNPLLLNFVCILANLSSTEQAKYQDFGIKSLGDMWNKNLENIIRNKSDLYESITRLIIYRHNEWKGIHLSKEELDIAMRELSEVAHCLFEWNNSDISDEYLQKLNILFKRSKTWELQFIHKSFREFLLAKYLINQTDGSEEIYNYRGKKWKENKWNDWRELKLTILFYGEMLGGAWKKEELEIFLWEGWLLNGDDIFGEGFFMGLEILHRLWDIEDIKKMYVDKIWSWGKKELINKLNKFIEFQKRIGYEENKFAQEYIRKCIDVGLMSDLGNGELLRLWTKEWSIYTYRLGLRFFEEGEYNKASSLFIELAKLGSKKWVEYAYKCGLWLIKTEEHWGSAESIFKELAKLWTKEWIRYAYEWACRLINEKKIGLFTEQVFIELAKLWTKEWMRYAYEWGLRMIEVEHYFSLHSIFEELAKLWTKEWMRYAYEWGLRIIEAENKHKEHEEFENMIFCNVGDIFIELARVWTREWIENACKFGFDLIKRNEYYHARSIFNELVELGSKIWLEYIRKFGLKLIELWDYDKRKETLIGLAKLGIREWVEYVSQCDSEPRQADEDNEIDDDLLSESWLWTEEWIKHAYEQGLVSIEERDYYDAEDTFKILVQGWTPEWMRYAYEWGLKLLEVGKYREAEHVFIELAKLWTDEWMQYAYEWGVKLIKKRGYERDSDIPTLFLELIKYWYEDWIKYVYERGLELMEVNQDGLNASFIFAHLIDQWNEKWIIYAYKWALRMFEKKIREAPQIFLMLARLWNKEWLIYAYKCGIELIKNEEYNSAYYISTKLVELWTEEWIKYAYDWALRLLEVGEYRSATYLFTYLSKLWWEKEEFILSAQKSLDWLYETWEYSEYLMFIDDLQGLNYRIVD